MSLTQAKPTRPTVEGADVATESDQGAEVIFLRRTLALRLCLSHSGNGHFFFLNAQVIRGCVSKIYTDVVLFYSSLHLLGGISFSVNNRG